jgi:hypothetical protein
MDACGQLVAMLRAEGCQHVGTLRPFTGRDRGQTVDVWRREGETVLVGYSHGGLDLFVRLDCRREAFRRE